MLNNKKGQGLSITTIVVAAIAVVVLVVLVAIVTGRLGIFSRTLGSEGDAARRTDSLINNCIPEDAVYQRITADNFETQMAAKDKELNTCKVLTKATCDPDDNKKPCQWVGG